METRLDGRIPVAYGLDLEENVSSYLREASLSRQGRVKLFAMLHSRREFPASYLNHPERRFSQDSPYFWFDYLFRDDQGDRKFHHFWFVISDAAAQYGVLRVAYAAEKLVNS